MREDKDWEQVVMELKDRLPVNQELKRQLRQELLGDGGDQVDHQFVDQSLADQMKTDPTREPSTTKMKNHQSRTSRSATYYLKWTMAVALVASVLFVTVWWMKEKDNQVAASALHLYEQYSVFEQLGNEQSEGMAEYNGTAYLPIKEKGLYQLDSKKLTKLIEGNINFVRVSPDGKQLVYVQQGSLYLYNIESEQSQLLLSQGNGLGKLSTPAWSSDSKHMLFVSQQDSNDQGEIMSVSLTDKSWEKITTGQYPAYLANQEGIFLERNKQIIYLNLDTKEEKVLDSGQSPAVSNDGSYVAYVKSEGNPELQNLWIADTNFKTKKQITSNQLGAAYDPDTGEYIEGKQQAQYTLEQPAWSNNDNRLYVYKVFHTNETWRKLTRLQLSTAKLTPSDIVGNSIAALIYRDEEYAHSFFNYDPGYLKGTNPRQVGYRINNSVQQGGNTIVDAETYLAYYDPYYRIDKQRYTVEDTKQGYKISNMEPLGTLEITDREDGIYLTKYAPGEDDVISLGSNNPPKERILLLQHDNLPKEQGWVNGAVNSLQYNEAEQHLFVTLSRTAGEESKIVLLDYDLQTKSFKEYVVWQGKGEAQTTLLQVNSNQRYAAVSVELGRHHSDIRIVELADGNTVSMAEYVQGIDNYSLVSRYWDKDKFIFYAETKTRDVFFSYDPQEKLIFIR